MTEPALKYRDDRGDDAENIAYRLEQIERWRDGYGSNTGAESRLVKIEKWQVFVIGIVSSVSFCGGLLSAVIGWVIAWKK